MRTDCVTFSMFKTPLDDDSLSTMTRFLFSVLKQDPLSMYDWISSNCTFLARSSDQTTSQRARKESLDSSCFWRQRKSALSTMSYFFSKLTFPHWPPRSWTSSCTPFLSFVIIHRGLFSWSFWKAVPLVFKMRRVINSLIFVAGQISLSSSTFCVYCSKSSFDGSNVGTSVAMWFDEAVFPSVEAAVAVPSDIQKNHQMLSKVPWGFIR